MSKVSKLIFALSLVTLSSCSIFTSKRATEPITEVASEPEVHVLAVAVPQNERPKIEIEEVKPEVEKVVEEVEVKRDPIGPFTTEQSASVVIPEFKSQLLLSDMEVKLPELKGSEFHYPADGHVTSPYGWRGGRMHTGVDIKAYRGDNIYSTFDGVVRFARYNGAYGNCIVIRHYNGLETMYAHATKLLVKVNQEVAAGDIIALAGRTGRATGDHLHFEVRVAGQCIDPRLILDTENRGMVDKNLYITMRSGRVFASNEDQKESREEQIKDILSVKYHIVRSGDTLSRIAANNRTTVTNLCKMNNISSRSILSIGQRVRVQ